MAVKRAKEPSPYVTDLVRLYFYGLRATGVINNRVGAGERKRAARGATDDDGWRKDEGRVRGK